MGVGATVIAQTRLARGVRAVTDLWLARQPTHPAAHRFTVSAELPTQRRNYLVASALTPMICAAQVGYGRNLERLCVAARPSDRPTHHDGPRQLALPERQPSEE
ncbi:hypothetical protein MPSD_51510 [Mycobacterium pseudoshottsii JCM 15466]|uniref:Uncharacterized protein n=1 Tax=Mycobacterium pseudoshottsii TaxID=265949 RepID=A0A9N7LWJ5_9MYCO|nr:hypothetical protein [Mycobacterium ulcerans]BBA90409.1 hypothetical protein MPSD_51510 [Mycobacterium pseudoshottsii JCM 15466]BDN84888.1 hypothetical protein NJB1907Z4_C51030 [Mycobacterium pseudoshottsii]